MVDIVPELLETLEKDFNRQYYDSKKIGKLLAVKQKSYQNAYDFAEEVGNIQAKVFKRNISSAILPEGKMFYNIADRVINGTLRNDYELVASYSREAQTAINRSAKISLKAKAAEMNLDRLRGFTERLSGGEEFDAIAWILDEPVKVFSLSVVDDTIKKNAEFQASAGIVSTVTRIAVNGCCAWCDDLAGTYSAPFDPSIFARHDNCRCQIDYQGKKMKTSGNAFHRW